MRSGEGGKREWKKRGEKGSQGGFVDGSHEWGREGSDDCGIRVAMEESGKETDVSKVKPVCWE